MPLTEVIVQILTKLGFRGPGEPSRKELRTAIKSANERSTKCVATVEEGAERVHRASSANLALHGHPSK